MKTLVSAETVRQAHARGDKCLPGGKDVLVTPEARGLAEQLGLPFVVDAVSVSAPINGETDAIREAVLARLQATAGQKAMLQRVERFAVTAVPRTAPHPVREAVESLGCMVIQAREHLLAMVQLIGQLVLDVLRLLRAPLRGPWRDVSGHLYSMGAMALFGEK